MRPMTRFAAILAIMVGALSALAPLPGARVAAEDADLTPPTLVARTPEPGPGAPTKATITATFDEAVQNVTGATFVLRDEDGEPRDAEASWDPETLTATLTAAKPLTIASHYTAKLRKGITDLAGNELSPVKWSFTTTDRVVFGPGTFTGYRFDSERTTFRAIKRSTLDGESRPTADRFRRINGQGFLYVTGGRWDGYWVHGRPWGRARDDGEAPVTFRPACSYVDLPSARVAYTQWATTVLDTLFRLPTGYEPSGLVDTSRAGLNGGFRVRRVVLDDLTAMVRNARRAGAYLAVQSAYRSYASQVATFDYWIRHVGRAEALKVSARPGHSEHQLGTTIDFRSAGGSVPWGAFDWGDTREGSWMKRNAWKYGWVMSYPAGTFAASCYSYEPWHYRYVGRKLAAAIHDAGKAPRAVFWGKGFGIR
jgi:D-alanyl-D-alanine carboxypeptidase